MPTLRSLLLTAAIAGGTALPAQDMVWWEGEDFDETNIEEPVDMRTPGNRNAEQQAVLSEGRWLTVGETADGAAPRITYTVEVPADGTYNFWVRKFWKHGPFNWRFDDREWTHLGKDITLHDSAHLQRHWSASWVSLGEVELSAGEHRFEVEVLETKGCFDCFLLIDGTFTPRGKLRPGERTGLAEEGFFAWEPDLDPLTGESPLDLRHLNESAAGVNGFVTRDGADFALGSGERVRFWMVQGSGLMNMDPAATERWAKRLAKYGVNLVRLQMSDFFRSYRDGDDERFATRLDRLHQVVAALKDEGIYVYLGHLYWHTKDALPAGIVRGFEGGEAIALPFVSEEFQAWYRDYLAAILTPENPYTRVPLAAEPALAFLEINNESSLLFHTFSPQRFSEAELAYVERSFGDWLVAKYGSLQAAQQAWGPSDKHTPDHPDQGRMGLYAAGFLGDADWAVSQRNNDRASDQLQWMIEATRDYYAAVRQTIRDDIGAGSLVSGSNWKTASPRVLGGLERYTYTATDVVLRNSYFATEYPNSEARQRFYAVEENDVYASVSALLAPSMPKPLATPQIAGYPFMVTENNWTRPNRFRAEWPVLVASYASLQGLDGWCFFALDSSEWQVPMAVWDLNNPTILGQFPATALMYRRGDIAQPEQAAVHEYLALEDAYDLQGTRIAAGASNDAMWAVAMGEDAQDDDSSTSANAIDARAFFVGPVLQEFHDAPSRVESVDLGDYLDNEDQSVRSLTGELRWDYATGVLTIDTPRAQGATGFLAAAGRIELGDVVIESRNEYGSILVVALDGKPIAESSQVLIQAATEDRPYGFTTRPQGEYQRITDLGSFPLNVRQIDAEVQVRNAASEAVILDGNGYPTDASPELTAEGGMLTLTLPEDAIYTVLQR